MKNHTMGSEQNIDDRTFKDRRFVLEQGISTRVVEIGCIVRDVNRSDFQEVIDGYFSPLVHSSSKEKLDEIRRLVKDLKTAHNLSCACDGFHHCGKEEKIALAKLNLTSYLENL
jgi:hypothetical protein